MSPRREKHHEWPNEVELFFSGERDKQRQVINREDAKHAAKIETAQSVLGFVAAIAEQDPGDQETTQHEEQSHREKAKREIVAREITVHRQEVMDHHSQHRERAQRVELWHVLER